MIRTVTRFTLGLALALCLGLAFTPLGCGGSQRVDVGPPPGEGPGIPDATISALRACAEQGRAHLKETSYAFQFVVEATEDGHADRVRLKDSFPSDDGMEACMARALEDMPVPLSVVQALSQQAEQAEAVSPQSRGLMGNLLVLVGGSISLVPALVTAAGVTIVVGVAISLGRDVVETIREKRKRRERCLNMFVKCQGIGGVCTRLILPNTSLDVCGVCMDDCNAPKPYTHKECYSCGFDDF